MNKQRFREVFQEWVNDPEKLEMLKEFRIGHPDAEGAKVLHAALAVQESLLNRIEYLEDKINKLESIINTK